MADDGRFSSSSEEGDESLTERTTLLDSRFLGYNHDKRVRSQQVRCEVCSWIRHLASCCADAGAEQLAVLRQFCLPKYRLAMCVVWATALGGAMHEPAVPFFYLGLGLSAAQIGQAGGILTAGSLLLSPVYGWLFDKKSAELALVLAISLCGGGCLLRALATGPSTVLLAALVMSVDGSFESLVLAYVVRDTAPSQLHKGAVISAFLVQVQLVRIIGRALYPAWNWLVRVSFGVDDVSDAAVEAAVGNGRATGLHHLLRFRLVLGSCVVPCVVGFFMLLCHYFGPHSRRQPQVVSEVGAEHKLESIGPQSSQTVSSHVSDARGSLAPAAAPTGGAVCALTTALVCQGASAALLYVLWPLFLHAHFGVDDVDFAPLLLAASLASATALALAAPLQRWLGGPIRTAAIAGISAGLGAPAAFAMQCPDSLLLHTALVLPTAAAISLLEASLKAGASELAPIRWQGSTFGVMASLIGIGSVVASVGGSMLYEHSLGPLQEQGQVGGGGGSHHERNLTRATHDGHDALLDDSSMVGGNQELWSTCNDGGVFTTGFRGSGGGKGSLGAVALGLGGLLPFLIAGAASVLASCGLLIFSR